MSQPAIVINNITKKYYLEKPRTLKKWFHTIISPFEKFTVFKNFSLSVNKGEFILITGSNGSGKTTLLKLIAGITFPDEGSIKTYGRIVPLIELGAGFNYELTGEENIVTNATILGIQKSKIKEIIPKIVSFSGLKDFIDVPLKRYSTGMVTRLAFSIAVYSNPNILLIDEIFAVGDNEFRKKSIKRILDFKKKSITIVLTSNFRIEKYICDREIKLINSFQTS